MSLACGLVVTDDNADSKSRYYFLNEALSRAAAALSFAIEGNMSAQWIGEMIDKVNDLVAHSLVEAGCISSSRIGGVMQQLVTVVHDSTAQHHVRVIVALALLDRTNKKAALAIAHGDPDKALAIVNERAALVDSTAEWGSQPQCVGLLTRFTAHRPASAIQAPWPLPRSNYKRERNYARKVSSMESTWTRCSKQWMLFDLASCHDMHVDIEAELLSEIGYIWSNILKVKEAAHRAYRASLLCAHACSPREFISHPWFKRARDSEEAFQHEEALEEKRKKDEADAPFLKELKPELIALKALSANSTPIDAALKYIIATYPGGTPFVEYDAAT
ncbi:Hypothetical protein, putative, partial [Bodo saltans]